MKTTSRPSFTRAADPTSSRRSDRRDGAYDDDYDDGEDEEEMISLGLLSEEGVRTTAGGDNVVVVVEDLAAAGAAPGSAVASSSSSTSVTTEVGANRKSFHPATPASSTVGHGLARGGGDRRGGDRRHRVFDGDGSDFGAGGGGGEQPMMLRRTPGPTGASSSSLAAAAAARHRRTPGAPDLNRSHAKTPVMSGGGGNRLGKTPHKSSSLSSSSLVTPSNKTLHNNGNDGMETPIMNSIGMGNGNGNGNGGSNNNTNQYQPQHERRLYTPAHFTLAKNAELHMDSRPDAFSPATIRMTDSLEKILTDDDDFLDAKQRLQVQQMQQAQQSQLRRKVETDSNRNAITSNDDGDDVVVYKAYRPGIPDDDVDDITAGRGAFRRIRSMGSDSADEEMDEMKDFDVSERAGKLHAMSQEKEEEEDDDEEEEEAEISQINDNEDAGDDDDGEPKTDVSIGRPKPLNFDRPSGPPTSDGDPSSVVSASNGGAFKPAKRVTVPTTKPRPQRTMPRHAGGGPVYQGIGAHHPSQHSRGGIYYPQPQQQGYFGQHPGGGGGAEGMMVHNYPQHPTPNMLFNEQQSHPLLQYSHPQSHYQYAPSHHSQHHQHHHHQSFQLPPMPSPQNVGFGPILPMGIVSPLNLPTDYSQGHSTFEYHPHSHGNVGNAGGGPYPHHDGLGGDHWWRAGRSGHDGFDHSMAPQQHHSVQHHLDNAQQQGGMGMIPISGNPSPDFSFHEMSGAVSPFNLLPFPSFPSPTQSSHYPRQSHHHHAMAPEIYHPSVTPVASRPRTKSKENQGPRASNIRRVSSPFQTSSLTKHQGPPGQSRMCRRKDSTTSVDSALRGEDDQGGQSFYEIAPSPKFSSTAPLRQALPGLNTTVSSEEDLDRNEWFYRSDQKNAPLPHCKPELNEAAGRGIKEGTQERLRMEAVMSMQSIPGPGDNNRLRLSVGEMKVQQQRGKDSFAKQPRDRPAPPHLDVLRTNPGYYHEEGVNAGGGFAENDDARHSRGDFVIESPLERQAFKEFGKHFRQRENESLNAARDYALACLSESNRDVFLPFATHWRVHLELADVAKRSNQTNVARSHYRQACALQPRASQGWLEHSKLEEECGNLRKCAAILQEGLKQCETNENLLIRAVKFYERMGDLDQARQLLSRLKYLSIDKSWKTMLEGGLLEARAGRYSMAREVLKFLTHNVPWYGPLYLAHTKLERDYGSPAEAFSIVEKGLKELPRYGPLYFQAFRLLEKEDLSRKDFHLPRTMEMVSRADSISRELLWKVHLESAQMHERAAELAVEDDPKHLDLKVALQATRRSYAKAISLCPPNLSWKIWLASGQTELSCGNTRGARELFFRAHDSVSEKGRSTVLLECARLEEYCGDLSLSRAILCKARQQFGKSDWKVWLSSIALEYRCGLRERAIAFAQEALNIHRGTGRLWAALIQLCHDDGEFYQMKVLKCALQAVPKSGEVWCEGARIHLNPFSPTFDLQAASRHLSFAARFTPQYGDSFLEQLRLNMIDQWLIPLATPFINTMFDAFLSSDKMQVEDAYRFIAEHTKETAVVVKTQLKEGIIPVTKDVLDTSELELRCSSADPNYGHLWFQCRNSSIDTAREVIAQARVVMADSIIDYSYLYIAAMVRRAGVLMLIHHQGENITVPTTSENALQPKLSGQGLSRPNSESWDVVVDRRLRSVPPLHEMLSSLPESDVGSISFKTGCAGINRSWDKLTLPEKRRVLFGSDSLLN